MGYTSVLPIATTPVAVAALPNTGGSHSVLTYVALASIAFGVAVLLSTAVRFVAKRHFSA